MSSLENERLKEYVPAVKAIARRLIARLPSNVEIDDLVQVGLLALHQAFERFDPEQGVQFLTFATPRVQGAMLDERRNDDWMPRKSRSEQRKFNEVKRKLVTQHGYASDSDLAEGLGISLDDLREQQLGHSLTLLHIEGLGFSDDSGNDNNRADFLEHNDVASIIGENLDPLVLLEAKQQDEFMESALSCLNDRERQIVTLMLDGHTQTGIGELLNVSGSRINQLKARAVQKLAVRARRQDMC